MSIYKTIRIELGNSSYDINVGDGLLSSVGDFFNLNRRIAIVTDSGVPEEYASAVAACCNDARIITVPNGEENKNIGTYTYICEQLLSYGLQRQDAVIAVGGGVVGDMAGFAASTYMRGIDFYNVPTTLLSQVDSSIGGKCAVDFGGVKNIIGAFHQPKGVLIDTDVLKTLDRRQINAGLAEVIKMSLTSDKELFSRLCDGLWQTDIKEVITSSLMIKKAVVEADERESSLRRILNFGHTIGHGIEASTDYLHGECVALGTLPMMSGELRGTVRELYAKIGLPTSFSGINRDDVSAFMKHDKKGVGDMTYAVFVDEAGSYRMEKVSFDYLTKLLHDCIYSEE